jgi:hypothetical protein
MAQFFDHFGTYSNGDIASVSGGAFSKQASTTSWLYEVRTDGGATGGRTLVIEDDSLNWGDGGGTVVYDTAGASTGDFEIYCRMKLASVANLTADRAIGPALVAANGNAYSLRYDGTDVLLSYFQGSAFANIGSTIAIALADNTYFKVRLGRSGTTIRLKCWADGDAEPGSWQASGTHSTLTTVKTGIQVYDYNAGPYTFDALGFGTAGDAAPTSAPASGPGLIRLSREGGGMGPGMSGGMRG